MMIASPERYAQERRDELAASDFRMPDEDIETYYMAYWLVAQTILETGERDYRHLIERVQEVVSDERTLNKDDDEMWQERLGTDLGKDHALPKAAYVILYIGGGVDFVADEAVAQTEFVADALPAMELGAPNVGRHLRVVKHPKGE
jgi:hypothetical protein